MKCRSMKEMSNAEAVTMKNGRPATRGTLPGLFHEDVPNWQGYLALRFQLTSASR